MPLTASCAQIQKNISICPTQCTGVAEALLQAVSLSWRCSVHAPKSSLVESKFKQGNKPWKWEKEGESKQQKYMIKGNNQDLRSNTDVNK